MPNTEVCAVAGVMAAGADCAETQTNKQRSMELNEFIEYLEPQESPPRGAALCQSAEDWNKQKTALETACKKLGAACTYEMQRVLKSVSGNIDGLAAKAEAKKRLRANK